MYGPSTLLRTLRVGSVTMRASAEPDPDAETDWMDKGTLLQVRMKRLFSFSTVVEIERNGHVIGRDSLCGTWAKGDSDPYLMQTVREQVVGPAVADARKTLNLPNKEHRP